MGRQRSLLKNRISGETLLWALTVAAVFGSCGTSILSTREPSGNDPQVTGGRNISSFGESESASFSVALLKRNGADLGSRNTEWEVLCSGSVISPYHILTAAHCFEQVGAERVAVRFPFATSFELGTIRARAIHVHEDYRPDLPTKPSVGAKPNDIALVVLSEPIPSGYRAARLASAENIDSSITPESFLLAGFGTSRTRDFVDSGVLRATEISLRRANSVRATLETVGGNSGAPQGGCAGDSGAPIVSSGDVIFGVLSTGGEIDGVCVGTNTFTDVRSYRGWIRKFVENAGQTASFVESGLAGHESAVVDFSQAQAALDRGAAAFPLSIHRHQGMLGSAFPPPGLLPPEAFCRIELRMMFQDSRRSFKGFEVATWNSPGFELSGQSGLTFYVPSPILRPESFSAGVSMTCDGKTVTVSSHAMVSGRP